MAKLLFEKEGTLCFVELSDRNCELLFRTVVKIKGVSQDGSYVEKMPGDTCVLLWGIVGKKRHPISLQEAMELMKPDEA